MADRDYEQEWYTSNRALHAAWAERDRYRAALVEIAKGKAHEDNVHPLTAERGPYAAMAMRFISIAQAALRPNAARGGAK